MLKWLHSKSNIDRLYVGRKEGGTGLRSYESTVRIKENNHGCYHKNSDGFYLKNSDEDLLRGIKYVEILKIRESLKKTLLKNAKVED